jgi:hypothetical protein
MAKKKTDKERPVELVVNALKEYLDLSKFLFADPDNSIYDVNELEPDEQFYPLAKELAKELKIGWEDMSHEDSNRIMLLMLEKAYQKIREVTDRSKITIEFKVKELAPENGSTKD